MDAVVKIQNYSKSFGSKKVHSDLNLDVFEGECLGLIGGSGAGKSVILRSLIGLEKPDSGSINIQGEDISHFSEKDLLKIRKQVAYVFQGGALFDSLSVFDNLAYSLREHTHFSEKEIDSLVRLTLKDFGLAGNEEIFPSDLSGGMQKRVGLARAIILEPSIVLYDEPTAGLDPFNTKKIQEIILKLKSRGVTSILVTHDMPSAFAVCDRIAMLENGQIGSVIEKSQFNKIESGSIYKFVTGEIE